MSTYLTYVKSATDPTKSYAVRVFAVDQSVCECWKWKRQRACHHQPIAVERFQHEQAKQQARSVPAQHDFILGRLDHLVWLATVRPLTEAEQGEITKRRIDLQRKEQGNSRWTVQRVGQSGDRLRPEEGDRMGGSTPRSLA